MNECSDAEMSLDKSDDDPVGYLIEELESFILRMALEIDRLRLRIQELESERKSAAEAGDKFK